jgi:hypothetical protein
MDTNNKADYSIPPHKPNPTTSFMFVNETSDSPAYKVGDRQHIRSFVRKHSARQFKETHKTGWKKGATEQNWKPLATAIGSNQTLVVESTTAHPVINVLGATVRDVRSNLPSYCEAYGGQGNYRRLNKRSRQKSMNMILGKQGLRRLLEPSPLEILGAGRIDPFSSYPVEKPDRSLSELMDYGKSPYLYLLLMVSPYIGLLIYSLTLT